MRAESACSEPFRTRLIDDIRRALPIGFVVWVAVLVLPLGSALSRATKNP